MRLGGRGRRSAARSENRWLRAQLRASQARVKLIGGGSQWSSDGSADSWALHESERDELLDYVMESSIEGVVLISGDVHRAELRRLRPSTEHSYEVWELTSSPLNAKLHACRTDTPTDELLFCASTVRNFGLVTVDTSGDDPAVRLGAVAADGMPIGGVTLSLARLQMP